MKKVLLGLLIFIGSCTLSTNLAHAQLVGSRTAPNPSIFPDTYSKDCIVDGKVCTINTANKDGVSKSRQITYKFEVMSTEPTPAFTFCHFVVENTAPPAVEKYIQLYIRRSPTEDFVKLPEEGAKALPWQSAVYSKDIDPTAYEFGYMLGMQQDPLTMSFFSWKIDEKTCPKDTGPFLRCMNDNICKISTVAKTDDTRCKKSNGKKDGEPCDPPVENKFLTRCTKETQNGALVAICKSITSAELAANPDKYFCKGPTTDNCCSTANSNADCKDPDRPETGLEGGTALSVALAFVALIVGAVLFFR